MDKRALTPVITLLLLLLLTSVAFFSFQIWYNIYSDDLITKYTSQISDAKINIVELNSSALTVRNFGTVNLSYTNIKIETTLCNISGVIESLNLNYINLNSCFSGSKGEIKQVFIYSESDFYTQRMVVSNE